MRGCNASAVLEGSVEKCLCLEFGPPPALPLRGHVEGGAYEMSYH